MLYKLENNCKLLEEIVICSNIAHKKCELKWGSYILHVVWFWAGSVQGGLLYFLNFTNRFYLLPLEK